MRYTFDRASVERLLAHTLAATKHRMHFEDPETVRPGLWLVGRMGLYLWSNGMPPLLGDQYGYNGSQFVVYADQCNPEKAPFDTWWRAQKEGFGENDGSDFIDAAQITDCLAQSISTAPFILEVNETELTLIRRRRIRRIET